MRVLYPLKLSESYFVALGLFLLLHSQRLCSQKEEQQAVADLKQLVAQESPCNAVLSKRIDFYLLEIAIAAAENETEIHEDANMTELLTEMVRREKRDLVKVLPTDPGFENPPDRIRKHQKRAKEIDETTTTTEEVTTPTTSAVETTTTTEEETTKEPETTTSEEEATTAAAEEVKEEPKEELKETKKVEKPETTTEPVLNTTEDSEPTSNNAEMHEMMRWARLYTHRGTKDYSTCISMYPSDVLGVSDSVLMQGQLKGVRLSVVFLVMELLLLLVEFFYFFFTKDLPTKLGSLLIGCLHTFLASMAAAGLVSQRVSWEKSAWGPLDTPDHPTNFFVVEMIAWLLVIFHVLETVFYRYMKADVVLTRSAFGSYEVASHTEGRGAFIAAYQDPIDGSEEL